jgi:CRP/FNR family transcriptional regulator
VTLATLRHSDLDLMYDRSRLSPPVHEPAALLDHPSLARLSAFIKLTPAELLLLQSLGGAHRTLKRGEVLTDEGDDQPRCFVLIEGWTASAIAFPNGKRQIIKVHMPGDMLGTPSLALAQSPESITALTKTVVAPMPLSALGTLFRDAPRLAAILYLISVEERVMLMDRLAALGRSSAKERFASLVLQIHERLQRTSPDLGNVIDLPLSRIDLADLAGITTVHLNRVLHDLADANVLSWKGKTLEIFDFAALRDMSGLPPRHLTSDVGWLPPAHGPG